METLHRSKRTAYLYRPLINFQFKNRGASRQWPEPGKPANV